MEKLGDQHGFNPVGTGPFVLSDYKPSQGFTLTRNDQYFKGKPTLERIEMRTINDQDTAAIALKNGEIDVAMALRSEPSLDKATDPKIKFAIGDKWGISLWMFNMKTKSLGDLRVRQAIASAVDLPSSIKATAPRLQGVTNSIVPDWLPEYSADVPKYPFDLKKAKDLLSAAGLSNVSVKYMNLGNPTEFLTLVAASLAQVGIKMEFEIVDRAQFNQRRISGDFEITGRGNPAANINGILFNYLHPDYIVPNGFNSAHYSNPTLTQKLEAARSELDKPKRQSLYAEVQKIAMTDLPYLPTNVSNEYWGYRSNINGVSCNRMPQGNWWDTSVGKA
jgi:peptide/nickel transport system substrate-binding protein